jgi:hypothetical protein
MGRVLTAASLASTSIGQAHSSCDPGSRHMADDRSGGRLVSEKSTGKHHGSR